MSAEDPFFALAYTAQQADHGQKIFGASCASCHGASGQGGRVPETIKGYAGMKAPPVAGKGALPNISTAENAYYFIKEHMPLQKPNMLSEQEAIDVVAFDLKANNVAKPNNQPLTLDKLAAIRIH